MLEFKPPENLAQLSPDDPAFPNIEDLDKCIITDYIAEEYNYIPEDNGWIVLIEAHDKDSVYTEIRSVLDVARIQGWCRKTPL